MTKEEYLIIRQTGMSFSSMLFKEKLNDKDDVHNAGKLLGLLKEGKFIFESDDDSDALTDYLIFERNKKGTRFIQKFYDSDVELPDLEEELLEAMLDSHASLFEVNKIDSENYTLILTDILDKNRKEYKLFDLGYSQTAKLGHIFFTRLLPVREVNITSGLMFLFDSIHKDRLFADISFARFKNNNHLNSSGLFVLIHKKYRFYGKEVQRLETDQLL